MLSTHQQFIRKKFMNNITELLLKYPIKTISIESDYFPSRIKKTHRLPKTNLRYWKYKFT